MLLLLAVVTTKTYAALPPSAQNNKDLDVIMDYVRSHEEVLVSLQLIDFSNYIIFYGNDCRVEFKRKRQLRLPGWVGPAAPLTVDKQVCGKSENSNQ